MNFREKLRKVLQLLDLSQKAADKQLASEDITAIATRYQKEFQATLREDMDADSRQPMSGRNEPVASVTGRYCTFYGKD